MPEGVRLGIYSDNVDRGRELWVLESAYQTFAAQLRTVLSNPSLTRDDVRSQVTRLVGATFAGETDRWVFEVCKLGAVLFGIPDQSETAKLLAVLAL